MWINLCKSINYKWSHIKYHKMLSGFGAMNVDGSGRCLTLQTKSHGNFRIFENAAKMMLMKQLPAHKCVDFRPTYNRHISLCIYTDKCSQISITVTVYALFPFKRVVFFFTNYLMQKATETSHSAPPTPWVKPLGNPPWVRRDRNQRTKWISSLRRWMALIFTRCAQECHELRLMIAILMPIKNDIDNGFILRRCWPILWQKETWKEEEEEEIVRGDMHPRSLT